MSIPETFSFDKEGEVVRFPSIQRYFLTILIILVALVSFGVGRLTGEKGGEVSINYDPSLLEAPTQAASVIGSTGVVSAGQVTASSQGTRYYLSHCKNTISEKNRVTFANAALAESAGYTLAATCKP
jgi:hypothetical protein